MPQVNTTRALAKVGWEPTMPHADETCELCAQLRQAYYSEAGDTHRPPIDPAHARLSM